MMLRLTTPLLLFICLSSTQAFEGAVSVAKTSSLSPPKTNKEPYRPTDAGTFTSLEVASVTTAPTAGTYNDKLQQTGGASVSNLSISLVKSIVGSGVLALPACLADLGGCAAKVVPLSIVLMAAMGALNAYLFSLMGRNCAATGTSSYAAAWQAAIAGEGDNNNNKSKHFVAATVALKTAVSCLGFAIVLADAGRSMAVAAGWEWVTRGQALFAITLSTLLPLSMLRDLRSLAPFSAMGVGGLGLTALSMMWRAVDGSYRPGGAFFSSQALPSVLGSTAAAAVGDTSVHWFKALVLATTLTTAFNAHYNAPKFYGELQEPSVANFNKVTRAAYIAAALSFVGIATAGYLTFGTACQGFILNNYSPYDPLINISRAALALSIIMTFPLPFQGLRDGVLDLFQVPSRDRTDTLVNGTTLGLLGGIATAAYVCKNLALVVAIGGGTCSTLVAAVFPVVMFLKRQKLQNKAHSRESRMARALMVFATGIGGSGVLLAIRKALAGV